MTQLTLTRLAEIEQAAADAIQWRTLTANGHHFGNVCDPATVAALCQIVKAAAAYVDEQDDDLNQYMTLKQLLRDAGLIEP